jgi:hypothetical protein
VQAILVRIGPLDPRGSAVGPESVVVGTAVLAAVRHTLQASVGDRRAAPVSQARLAARRRVPVDIVLRHYMAGHAVLAEFMVREAERHQNAAMSLGPALRAAAAETDRALAGIATAHREELAATRPRVVGRRRAEPTRRLLTGSRSTPPHSTIASIAGTWGWSSGPPKMKSSWPPWPVAGPGA